MNRWISVGAVALATALPVAGCGDSDSDSGLSKAEWIAQADTICKTEGDKIGQQAQETFGSKQPSKQELAKFATDTVVPNVQGQLDQIRELDPPSADKDQVNEILDAAESDLNKLKQNPDLVNDPKTFDNSDKLAQSYGLKECGSDS